MPEIGPDDVLVKVHKTGICGTDIHIYNWDDWAQKHRAGADDHRPRICRRDRRGRRRRDATSRSASASRARATSSACRAAPRAPASSISIPRPGASASTCPAPSPSMSRIPAFNVVPLPDAVDDEIGAILDPLGNAVHTALAFDIVGEDVLVTGAGPIGIMGAAVARHVGRAARRDHRRQPGTAGARRARSPTSCRSTSPTRICATSWTGSA